MVDKKADDKAKPEPEFDPGVKVLHKASGQMMEVGRKGYDAGEYPDWEPVEE